MYIGCIIENYLPENHPSIFKFLKNINVRVLTSINMMLYAIFIMLYVHKLILLLNSEVRK